MAITLEPNDGRRRAHNPGRRRPPSPHEEAAELRRRRGNERAGERRTLKNASEDTRYRDTFPPLLQRKPSGWSNAKFGQARNLYSGWVEAKVRLERNPYDVQAEMDRKRNWLRLVELADLTPSDRAATAQLFGHAQEGETS